MEGCLDLIVTKNVTYYGIDEKSVQGGQVICDCDTLSPRNSNGPMRGSDVVDQCQSSRRTRQCISAVAIQEENGKYVIDYFVGKQQVVILHLKDIYLRRSTIKGRKCSLEIIF